MNDEVIHENGEVVNRTKFKLSQHVMVILPQRSLQNVGRFALTHRRKCPFAHVVTSKRKSTSWFFSFIFFISWSVFRWNWTRVNEMNCKSLTITWQTDRFHLIKESRSGKLHLRAAEQGVPESALLSHTSRSYFFGSTVLEMISRHERDPSPVVGFIMQITNDMSHEGTLDWQT
jgi:hypothetical protein